VNARAGHDGSARLAGAVGNVTRALVAGLAAACVAPAAALDVRIEKTDGTVVAGVLEGIGPRELRLAAQPVLAVAAIRRVVVVAEGGADREPPPRVTVMGGAGLRLTGNDFLWQDGRAAILRDDGRIELPIDRVRTVAFGPVRGGDTEPAWLGALPEKPASDLVVVARQRDTEAPGFELVECAISAVEAEQVAVVLDEEPIRVNRGKVVGLHWLRATPGEAGGTAVEVGGGSLRGASVTWTPEALEIDGAVKLPGRLLRSIDYAAGRTVRLATLEPERKSVEPFFGGLTAAGRVGEFFAPRFLPAGAVAAGGLVVRPRTEIVWRVPADSRRFRARLAGPASGAGRVATVTIQADDREVFRSPAADRPAAEKEPAADLPIDVDVADARRLTITVDAAGGGPGGPVLFHDPVFEK
jgi:hypothetical protein